jgi:TrmH family RNA methyltransferase
MDLKRYRSDFSHSYCPGVFPTLELLQQRPDLVQAVLLDSKGDQNRGTDKIKRICRQQKIEIIQNDKLVRKLSKRGNTYAVGVFRKEKSSLDRNSNHLVLVNPSGMGNLGTIMRTMLGFGLKDLALIEPAADPFDPRAVRASMGSLFYLRIATYSAFSDYWGSYAAHNLYPLMTSGARSLPSVQFKPPFTMIFGEEASGLSPEFAQYGTAVCIPQQDDIDSFNLAVSVGITLYQSIQN